MRAFEKQRLVALLRHPARRVSYALESAAIERERHRGARAVDHEQDRAATGRNLHALDADLDRRLESLARRCNLVERLLADLLADDLAVGLHADHHAPALPVREGAERLQRLTQLTRRTRQLERRGLALGHELREAWFMCTHRVRWRYLANATRSATHPRVDRGRRTKPRSA
jgi:hypothetical protein